MTIVCRADFERPNVNYGWMTFSKTYSNKIKAARIWGAEWHAVSPIRNHKVSKQTSRHQRSRLVQQRVQHAGSAILDCEWGSDVDARRRVRLTLLTVILWKTSWAHIRHPSRVHAEDFHVARGSSFLKVLRKRPRKHIQGGFCHVGVRMAAIVVF